MKAGEKAAGIYANTEAASYFKCALSLMEDTEDKIQQRGYVLERLGDIKRLAGDLKDCIKFWNEALVLRVKLLENEKAAKLHGKMANVLWDKVGDKQKAKEHLEAALKILENEPESVELARVYKDSGHMHRRMGELAEALRLEEKALGLAEKLNALEVVADSCGELSAEVRLTGDFKKALEYSNRALTIALENGYWEAALWAYYRSYENLPSEQYEKRMDCIEKGLALAKKIGHVSFQSRFLAQKANEYCHLGELDKAVAVGEEGLVLARKAGDTFNASLLLETLGYAHLMLGEWEKSERYIEEASDVARNLNEYLTPIGRHRDLGLLYSSKEEYAKAKESFEKAVKLSEEAGIKASQMYSSYFLVWACVELGEVDRAQSLLESLQKFALETGDRYLVIREKTLRAMLFRAQKKYTESIELFEKTLKEAEAIKANVSDAYWFAKLALFEFARAYLERDEEGDREKAGELLDRALEMFHGMGAKKDIEKVEAGIAFIETGKMVAEPKRAELVSTGFADLDKLLYGGIASNCAVVLTSPSCSERDQLIKSFLEAGAKKGEVAFCFTINLGPIKKLAEEYQSTFNLFVCNPQVDSMVKDAPNVVKLKGVENLTEISIALTSAIRKLDLSVRGARRICLGFVSDVLLQHNAVQTRRWLTSLVAESKSAGFTTLAVFDPEMHSSQDARAILDLFDGEFNIREKETDKGLERYLRVRKMSGQKYLEDEVLLKKEQA